MGQVDRLSSDQNDYPAPDDRLVVVVIQLDEADWRDPTVRLSHVPEHIRHAQATGYPFAWQARGSSDDA